MCLHRITTLNPTLHSGTGYVMRRIDKYGNLYSIYYHHLFPDGYNYGKWYESKVDSEFLFSSDVTYPCGFHIFDTLNDAEMYQARCAQYEDKAIIKVEWKECIITGIESFAIPVRLVRWINHIERIESCVDHPQTLIH